MYANPYRELFYQDGTKKDLIIIVMADTEEEEPTILQNEDLEEESFELIDGICEGEPFTFQSCISCYVSFNTYYTERMIGKVISIYEVIEEHDNYPIPLGTFVVQSDNLNTDGVTREIIAYDFMYNIINTDVTDWYNSLEFPILQKDFRDSFFDEVGIEQQDISLINDDIELPKQFQDTDIIYGEMVVKCLCEFNGVLPHVDKDSILQYISLDRGNIHDVPLYPSLSTYPGQNTYPGRGYTGDYYNIYKNYYKEDSVIWANYTTMYPDGIQIRNENNEVAYQTNEGAQNPYTLNNNFLCFYLSEGQYNMVANRLLNKIKEFTYVPFEGIFMGDPCLEVGDRVLVYTQNGVEIVSYIFRKRTNGILVPFDTIETPGSYYLTQYNLGSAKNTAAAKTKNLEQRVGNLEKSGSGPLQIISCRELPANPSLNVLYLIQGEVVMQ